MAGRCVSSRAGQSSRPNSTAVRASSFPSSVTATIRLRLPQLDRSEIRLERRTDQGSQRLAVARFEGDRILRRHLRLECCRSRSSSVRAHGEQIGRRRDVGVQWVEAHQSPDRHDAARWTECLFGGARTAREHPVAAKDVFFGDEHEPPEFGDDFDLRDGGVAEIEHIAAMELLAFRVPPAGHLLRTFDLAAGSSTAQARTTAGGARRQSTLLAGRRWPERQAAMPRTA